jgi:hypothetical protein
MGIAIVLLLTLLSSYTHYHVLMEADFLSGQSRLENGDLNCLLLCTKQEFTAFRGFSHLFWAAGNLIEDSRCLHCQVAFSQANPLVLRC